jgi:hypothetical protein
MTRLLLCAGLLAAAGGCGGGGPPFCDVKGTVTIDGKPVTGGMIVFVDAGDINSKSGYLTIDGTYNLTQVPAGPVKVLVRTDQVKNMLDEKTAKMLQSKGVGAVADDPKVKGNKYVAIPAKYNQADTTDLKYDLKPNELNEINVELKK